MVDLCKVCWPSGIRLDRWRFCWAVELPADRLRIQFVLHRLIATPATLPWIIAPRWPERKFWHGPLLGEVMALDLDAMFDGHVVPIQCGDWELDELPVLLETLCQLDDVKE